MNVLRACTRLVLAAIRPSGATEGELLALASTFGWIGIAAMYAGTFAHQQLLLGVALVVMIAAFVLRLAVRARTKAAS
jgi:hypothetical protein